MTIKIFSKNYIYLGLLIIAGILIFSLLAYYVPSLSNINTSVLANTPTCPLTAEPGRTIVDFPSGLVLRANHSSFNSFGPFNLAQVLSEGTYDITLVSYDEHSDKPGQVQPEEQYFLKLFNASEDLVFTSNSISDLPETQDWLIEKVNTDALFADDITSFSIHHKLAFNSSNNVNSLQPICASFDLILQEPEPEDPKLTVIKTVNNDKGGNAQVSDFKLFVDDVEVISGEKNTFVPGTFVLTETNVSRYKASDWGGDCSSAGVIVLNEGDDKVCTITNTFVPLTTSSKNPVLTIEKTVSPTVTNAGSMVSYIIVVSNIGSGTANNVVLNDTLPNGFTYVETGLSTRSWNLGNLTSGSSVSTEYAVNIGESVANGDYTNTAVASASNYGFVSDTAVVKVQGEILGEEFEPILKIEKTADKSKVNPGGTVIYTITVTNIGEADAINMIVEDKLPPGFTNAATNSAITKWTVPVLEKGKSWQDSFVANVAHDVVQADYVNFAIAFSENHPEHVSAQYTIEVRLVEVLGDTGVSPLLLSIWFTALALLILSVYQIRKRHLI